LGREAKKGGEYVRELRDDVEKVQALVVISVSLLLTEMEGKGDGEEKEIRDVVCHEFSDEGGATRDDLVDEGLRDRV
jgi:hypothetical protein